MTFPRFRVFLLSFCVLCPVAVSAGPAVTVNSQVLDSMGAPPNTASLFLQSDEVRNFASRRAYGNDALYPGRQKFASIPAPPLERPQSSITQNLIKTEYVGTTNKFKPIAKNGAMGGWGGTFNTASAPPLGFTPMGAPLQSHPDARESRLPPGVQNFAQNAMSAMGFRWTDIDPRDRGTDLTVMRPAAVGPQLLEQVSFGKGETGIDSKAMARLKLAGTQLKANEGWSAELQGYADEKDPSRARRTALTRILEVRNSLIGMGIRGSRLGVKPLGIPSDNGPTDRVDIIVGK